MESLDRNTRSQRLFLLLEGDVDQIRLEVQLSMIPDMIKSAFDGSIKKVLLQ